MNPSNKKKKTQKQLEMLKLDEMLGDVANVERKSG